MFRWILFHFLLIAVFSFFIQRRNSNILEIERDVGKLHLVECLSFFFFFEIAFIVLVAQIVKGTNKEKHFALLLNSIKMCSLIREIWGSQFLDTFMKRKDVQVAIRPKLFSRGA